MVEINTACSSCAKNDVCRHVEDVKKLREELKEKQLYDFLKVNVACKYRVKILEAPIGHREC